MNNPCASFAGLVRCAEHAACTVRLTCGCGVRLRCATIACPVACDAVASLRPGATCYEAGVYCNHCALLLCLLVRVGARAGLNISWTDAMPSIVCLASGGWRVAGNPPPPYTAAAAEDKAN